jgi:phospholipid transport system substrate-binding protein
MAPGLRICALAATLVLAILPARGAIAAPAASETVRGFYEALLVAMKDGHALGERGRYAKLAPVVRETFDVPYMTQVAVGQSWTELPEPKRRELTETFGRYITATWAHRFKSYAGQKLEVTGERPTGAAPLVETRIIKPNGEPVSINYRMRRSGDVWRIADVYLDGTISEMATRRSEFTAVLRRQGVDELIRTLNSKIDTMLAGARLG